VIEFFGSRREAERMLAEVVRDEPDWLEQLRIDRIELGSESNNAAAVGLVSLTGAQRGAHPRRNIDLQVNEEIAIALGISRPPLALEPDCV
jgi:hypothetical protein